MTVRRVIGAPFRGLQTTLPTDNALDFVRIGEEAPTSLDREGFWSDVVRLYKTGLHPAVGLCLRHRGEVILDRTIGHLHHEPNQVPGPVVSPDTPFNLFSASKILTGVITLAMQEDGLLDIEKPVAHYFPQFGKHGKERITLRHLLNHTAGLPDMPRGIDPVAVMTTGHVPWDAVCDLPIQSDPGTKVAYHPVTGAVLLQEVCERVSGKDLCTLAAERILNPIGITDMNYGVAPHRVEEVAKHTLTGPPVPAAISNIFTRTVGVSLDQAVTLTNTPEFLTSVLPSANVITTGRSASRFMQMLLNGGTLDGVRVLRPETVRRATTDVTSLTLDGTFGFPMRYGLGLMMGGKRFSLFGLNTKRAFGHLGFTNVVVYADPARDLTVSFMNTGKPMLAPGMLRWYWVLQRLALKVPQR